MNRSWLCFATQVLPVPARPCIGLVFDVMQFAGEEETGEESSVKVLSNRSSRLEN